MPLTDAAIRNAKPGIKPDGEKTDKPYKIADGGGMYLEVMLNGSKYFRLKYRINGKEKRLALGVYPDTTLANAREKRSTARKQIANGIDPSEQKKAEKREKAIAAANLFKAVALAWLENVRPRWTDDHYTYTLRRFEAYAFPTIGNVPIADIDAPKLLEMARKIEARGVIETTRKVVMACGQVFRYGIASGLCSRNPAADLRGALKSRPAVEHMPALPLKELPDLIHKIKSYALDHGDKQTELALRLLMLTFVRTGELREATWDEFDIDNALWSIPKERMKMKVAHHVPLSLQAVEIIKQLKALNGSYSFVFPGRNPVNAMSKNTVLFALYRMGYHSRMTGHGFRAVASTKLNEMGFNPDAIERQLAHAERNKIRAAYHRSEYMDERKRMMQQWADFLDGIEADAKAIPLHERAA